MALETIIYPQGQIGNFGYDNYMLQDHIFSAYLENDTNNHINHHHHQESTTSLDHAYCGDQWDNPNSSSPEECNRVDGFIQRELGSPQYYRDMKVESKSATAAGPKRRKRAKNGKNKEELENQRMTHITVERNRRKQMNEYLAVIRSLMPASYAQRGDQASIVGGAINFVKELEQQLQALEVQKRANNNSHSPPPQPFSDFFSFPQYSISPVADNSDGNDSTTIMKNRLPAIAEIEVTMVESHVNLKIFSKKRQRQLLKLVTGLQCLWLTILHLNVTTVEQMVLYTLSVKLEDGCQLSTVEEIADAVNCVLWRIEEESLCSS
uniref:transcription factor bHLH94-like n=1 Tax=Erigeron canadensis TaxID=72917 RepID=UPI001CB90B9A|nr:transcription factor bHLH94-like [Erigeron canadensis]